MKIAVNLRLLNPGKIGGMEVYVRNVLHGMLGLDGDLRYLLFVTKDNIVTMDFPPDRVTTCLIDHKSHESVIRDVLGKEKPDVYFCPLFTLEPLIVDLPAVVNIPDIQHAYYPEFFPADVMEWRRRWLPPTMRLADAVLTLSDFSKRSMIERCGLAPDKVHAVHLAAEEMYGHGLDEGGLRAVKKKYALPEGYCFYPANPWPHKNHGNLLRAFARMRGLHGEPPRLILTGDRGAGYRDLRELVSRLGLDDDVTHLGFVDKGDMPYLYAAASCLVFPSLFEGFGMPVLEAMLAGCPVVSSNCTSLPEVGGDAVLYFNPEDIDDMAEKIGAVIRDQDLRSSLIVKGREQARRFSWSSTASLTLGVIRSAAAVPPKERRRKFPLVSVVTPSFNQGRYIGETIGSVLSQDYPRIEYIIADGGSTDETLDVIRRHGNKITWVSEPDGGQADGVNKGFRMAKGEVLGWLNSDDTYNPGAVRKSVERLLMKEDVVMTYGDAQFIDERGSVTGVYPTEPFSTDRLSEVCFICQPAVFLRAGVTGRVGYLDDRLQTCMDFDYWIRIGKHFGDGAVDYLRGEVIANSRMYPENKTFALRGKVYGEIMETVKRHFGCVPVSWIYGYLSDVAFGEKGGGAAQSGGMTRVRRLLCVLRFTWSLWGWRHPARLFRESLHAIAGNFSSLAGGGRIYDDRWVSEFALLVLRKEGGAGHLHVEGRHNWPLRQPLKIRVFTDGREIGQIVVRDKGPFSAGIVLPERDRGKDMLTVIMKPNRFFVPAQCGMGDDTRRLSFMLDEACLR